jgi:predicted nucleic acid-binding protein
VDVNGLGMSAAEAKSELDGLWPSFRLLRDERTIFEIWQRLILFHDVIGKHAHDARLVAAMLRHGITHLLTFNEPDFVRYSQITVLEPQNAGMLPGDV